MKSQVWIGKKRLKKPLIQGGMGIGVSLSGLAGAVAKEGGAGTISAAQIGFLQPEFEQNPVLANLKAMEEELQKARKIAPDGILGFNIMVAMNHYETYVRKAVEIGADAILLAKAVDGIYDSDPKVNPDAKKYDEISIDEVVAKKLAAMDLTASIMCMEQKMPMLVFGLDEKDSIVNTVHGKFSGTKVTV